MGRIIESQWGGMSRGCGLCGRWGSEGRSDSVAHPQDIQYTVAPESKLRHGDEHQISRLQTDNKKFNKFARQLKSGKAAR
jgi:hypothetical protein